MPLIYHRFNEPKYPSTNIQMDVFKDQINTIKSLNYEFYNPINFEHSFKNPKKKKKSYLQLMMHFSLFTLMLGLT